MKTEIGVFSSVACIVFSNWIACADSGSWNVQSGGEWSDRANWLNGVVAGGTGATAYFTNAPDSSVNRPVVMADTNLLLNGFWNWSGGGSTFSFVADRITNSLDFYAVDGGTSEFVDYTSRTVQWKVALKGTGAVKLSGVGLFLFRKEQPFTGPLYLMNRSNYKGMSCQSYAASADATIGDLLTTEEIHLDYSTFRVCGRYPRPASSGRSWELRPGESKVRLLDRGVNAETVLSPGQIVSGDHVHDGTYIAFFQDDSIVCLSQPLVDDFSGVLTQTLAFAAAPYWAVTQQIDHLISESGESVAVGGVQFQPYIEGGYGTNSVTLRVGELSGTHPLRVSVESSLGGWDGRLAVDHAETFALPITLEDTAALFLGDQTTVPTNSAPNAAFWVDASCEASLTKSADGAVTRWGDVRGGSYPIAASWLNTPHVRTNALNGLPVVDFDALGSNEGLAWDREITGIKAVFWVIGSQESGGTLLGCKPGYTTSYRRGFDCVHAIGNTSASYVIQRENGLVGYNQTSGDYVAVNGREVLLSGSGLSGGYDLVVASVPSQSYKASAFAFDAYDSGGARFSGGQRLAEVIVYTNALTTEEIKGTEAYLYKKWFNRETVGYGAGKANLVTVKSGAEARLGQAGGQPVEMRYLTSSGSVTITTGSTVTLKADSTCPALTLKDGAKVILKARKTPSAPPLDGSILWLDASREEDFILGDGNTVNAWQNRIGGNVVSVTPGTIKPSRVQDGEGRWMVDLGDRDAGCCLMTLTNLMTRSAFIVWFSRANGTLPLGSLAQGYAGHTEFRTGDFNRSGLSVMLSGAQKTTYGGEWFLDGLPIQATVTTIPTNRLMLTSAVMQGWGGRVSALGGQGFNNTSSTYLYSGGMQLAEVLLYDRTLSDDERRDVEAYLTKKWFGTLLLGYAGDDGGVTLQTVAVDGHAELKTQGNAVVRIAETRGTGALTLSGETPVSIVSVVANPNALTVISTGTVGVVVSRIAQGDAPSVPAAGAALHFDATVANSITFYAGSYAQYWKDQVTGVKAESAYGPMSWLPLYKTDAVNDLPVIDFEWRGRKRAYKWSPRLTNIRTVFWMFKDKGETTGGGWLLGDSTKASDFTRGGQGAHYGNSALFDADLASPSVVNGTVYLNGERVTVNRVPGWDYQVVSVTTTNDTAADMIAGDRDLAYTNDWSGMELGEVIIYTNALSEAACATTEDYLMNKWLGRRSPRVACADTQTVVAAYGAVPLFVTNATGRAGVITAFKGDGEVVVQGSAVTVLSDAESYSGRVVLRGDSHVTLAAAYFVGTEWVVEAGSVLDLEGQTVTVAGIGGDGCVSNGTLIVSHLVPGLSGTPGTLTINGDLILAEGATVTVNYNRPNCDSIHVTGTLSVRGTGTVTLEEPVGLSSGFNAPLFVYTQIENLDFLLTDWALNGDYPKGTYTFRLEHLDGTTTVLYKGFVKGTMMFVR